MKDNILLSNQEVVFSDVQENDIYLTAKFVICDFSPNLNNVMINRQTIGNWINTLVDQPVVGKLGETDSGEADFTSHNANVVIRLDEDGNRYQDINFDTSAIGVFTSVGIESINGKEYIVADAKIWKRFPDVCAVIKKRMASGTIATSWEVLVKKSHNQFIGGQKIKVIDDGAFEGHCLLASYVPPAYPDSQLLEIANKQETKVDDELVEALKRDIIAFNDSNINSQKEDEILKKQNKDIENSEVKTEVSEVVKENSVEKSSVEAVENSENKEEISTENKVEKSELTDNDVRQGLYNAISEKLGIPYYYFCIIANIVTSNTVWVQRWDSDNNSELDVLVFTYSVDNDVVTVSDPTEAKLTVSVSEINNIVSELNSKVEVLNSSIVEANTKIQDMSTQIAELTPFKEAADKAEQERIEAETASKREELKQHAIKSGFITEEELSSDDKIKDCISNVSKKDLDAIIAERFIASLNSKETKVENTQEIASANDTNNEATVKVNLANADDDVLDAKAVMKAYLGK
jgi:hypothetical protein